MAIPFLSEQTSNPNPTEQPPPVTIDMDVMENPIMAEEGLILAMEIPENPIMADVGVQNLDTDITPDFHNTVSLAINAATHTLAALSHNLEQPNNSSMNIIPGFFRRSHAKWKKIPQAALQRATGLEPPAAACSWISLLIRRWSSSRWKVIRWPALLIRNYGRSILCLGQLWHGAGGGTPDCGLWQTIFFDTVACAGRAHPPNPPQL